MSIEDVVASMKGLYIVALVVAVECIWLGWPWCLLPIVGLTLIWWGAIDVLRKDGAIPFRRDRQ